MAKTGKVSLFRLFPKPITPPIKQLLKTNLDNQETIIENMIREMRTSLKMDGKKLNKLDKEVPKLLLSNLKPIVLTQVTSENSLPLKFKEIPKEDC